LTAEDWYALRLTLKRTRKPHTREAAAKESWALRRNLERNPHMLNAAAWVEGRVKASIQHSRILHNLTKVVAGNGKPRRQGVHHASPELRLEVIRLYVEGRAAGLSERAVCRQITEATGVKRTNVQRWVAQFGNESTESLHMRGQNDVNNTAVIEAIRAEGEKTREAIERAQHETMLLLYAFERDGETPASEWDAYLAERRKRSTP
jgi:transposase-like protein